jgi:hypothetical protein
MASGSRRVKARDPNPMPRPQFITWMAQSGSFKSFHAADEYFFVVSVGSSIP